MLYQLSYSGETHIVAAPSGTYANLTTWTTPKDIGDRSTLAIMLALRQAGYALYMPFGENTRCDLLIEDERVLAKVQCKTGRLRNGAVVFLVCSTYGHHRNPARARRTYVGQVDFFAVFCPRPSRCISSHSKTYQPEQAQPSA